MGMVEDELRTLVDTFTKDPDRRRSGIWTPWRPRSSRSCRCPRDEHPEKWRKLNAPELADHLVTLAETAYDEREQALGTPAMRQIERLIMLRAVDNRWMRHLTDLDELREGIGLRAFAQQDPLIAYKKEAHEMYQEFAGLDRARHRLRHLSRAARHPACAAGAADADQPQRRRRPAQPQPVRSGKTLGRNDPCWCGSGKKYKQCHMRSDEGRGRRADRR